MLCACYELDGVTTDGSANGNHLTVSNTAFGDGRSSRARHERQQLGHEKQPFEPQCDPISVDMWIFPTVMPPAVHEWASGEGQSVRPVPSPGGEVRCLFGLTGSQGVATAIVTGVTVSSWNHIGCTYDGTTLRLYIGGTPRDTDSLSGSVRTTITGAGLLRIGEEAPDGGDRFLGTIDRVRIWSTAISDRNLPGRGTVSSFATPGSSERGPPREAHLAIARCLRARILRTRRSWKDLLDDLGRI